MTFTAVSAPTAHLDGLDAVQVGHLRHIRNLLTQLPGDWSHMGGRGPAQDDFGGLRYQLAYMTYALAVAHRNRLPAAPGVFKPLFEHAIEKLLSSDVWAYWRDTSRGGAPWNAHLSDGYEETWNPVLRDNIMYSAYVQSIALTYHYLFQDDRYAQPGALTFTQYTPFWGGEGHSFAYDENSLNDHIYWLMAQSGYLGVACEPNCIFQMCNQPPILGFRMKDLIEGTSVAEQVTRDYEAAWQRFGRLDPDGHFYSFVLVDADIPIPNGDGAAGGDAGVGALMSMWNRDVVAERYRDQLATYLVEGPDDTLSVKFAGLSSLFPPGVTPIPIDNADFGWTTAWAAEMGDAETLERLFRHVDRYMNPTIRDGGRYYPRNDTATDGDGNRTEVSPLEGNALYSWARLTVPSGLWTLYNVPLEPEHFRNPAIIGVGSDVDVSLAYVAPETRDLHIEVTRRDDVRGDGTVDLARIDVRSWSVIEAGVELASSSTPQSDAATFEVVDGTLRVTLHDHRSHRWIVREGVSR
ncbi:hypothetical protein K0817_011545 [Microbacterium sp. HD4P20]|uniref:linalool dehydratase/isomerase domain-containing protein n=1 Tax=Microbacterium sp. HD4P20 TaxID=2864874 RepID=UPI001C641234|nr:hypothetical protein [Microbacterium sp. HD4P20]MCP2637192.1 hypothetical protein [Microbacterium sp. HD4P20]